MKPKGATSLYEVLKTASRAANDPASAAPAAPAPAGADAAPQATLQERLAAYKAQKLAAATSSDPAPAEAPAPLPIETPTAVAVAEPSPPPAPPPPPRLVAPPPPPAPAPTVEVVEAPTPDKDPGERVLRLTYNTAAFAGLVVVGLLFVAYALGSQQGRRRAIAETLAERPAPPPAAVLASPRLETPPPPPPPPPPAKAHTIWLAEWKYGLASERVKAEEAARQLTAALAKANLRGAKSMKVQRGGETRLGLHIDEVTETATPDARARLEAIRKFRFNGQAPFAQASYVELPK